mmetsp:Transcript_44417/g.71275  ORF Transcript_44417/g.71275 Transcript_44417/m.71275 type:complete len:210 (-) Transcript_44417:462-1091(-)
MVYLPCRCRMKSSPAPALWKTTPPLPPGSLPRARVCPPCRRTGRSGAGQCWEVAASMSAREGDRPKEMLPPGVVAAVAAAVALAWEPAHPSTNCSTSSKCNFWPVVGSRLLSTSPCARPPADHLRLPHPLPPLHPRPPTPFPSTPRSCTTGTSNSRTSRTSSTSASRNSSSFNSSNTGSSTYSICSKCRSRRCSRCRRRRTRRPRRRGA